MIHSVQYHLESEDEPYDYFMQEVTSVHALQS